MKKYIIFLFIILLCSSVYAGQMYIWTDNNGLTHITQQPPPENTELKEVVPYNKRTYQPYQQQKYNNPTLERPDNQKQRVADVISQMCADKWGNNYKMVNYCIKKQKAAEREISAYTGTIRRNCEKKWGNNFKMVLYCIKNQTAAKRSVDSSSKDEISSFCTNKWGQNYKMVDYCIKNQKAAKENIERNYSGYKRSRCEQKWGNNYKMVEYCIKN